ncbi:MAG: PEGA domain-containing protein [Acidobacteria bacterium]|nr:PEGA domain-containing protein [Acidobacteriota bacterium]
MTLHVEDGARTTRLGEGDFPIALGGPDSPVEIPGTPAPLAWLGLGDGDVFIQPAGGVPVVCNGTRLAASHWLRDGDVLRIGSTQLEAALRADGVHLRVAQLADLNPTEPPVVLVPPPREPPPAAEEGSAGRAVTPITFTPGTMGETRTGGLRRRLSRLLVGVLVAAVALLVAFIATARSVEVTIDPEPDDVALEGFPPAVPWGSSFVARPGSYTLVAEKEGYRRLEAPVEVTTSSRQALEYTLERLPGRLVVHTGDVEGAELVVDGEVVGTSPLAPVSVPAGEREIVVRAEGYVEFRTTLEIEGRGAEQQLEVALAANSAPVSFATVPPGATVRVDGRSLGTTPLTTAVSAGRREVTYSLNAFKPASRRITVAAGRPLTVPPVELAPADAVLALASDPAGAAVTVDGKWRGETPLELVVAPGRALDVKVTKAGHEDADLTVEIAPGERREESLSLAPRLGEVQVEARPPDAELLVDGEPRGRASQTLSLIALPHEILIRREGYLPHKQTVTPRPGFTQAVKVTLKSEEQAREESMPPRTTAASGQELVLVKGMQIKMGAPRREPGRRANEPLRDVQLVRPFYVATTEVSNAQFREFLASHDSGRAGTRSLNVDTYPVVRVTWEQAAAYCNWLSQRDGLPPAYEQRGGRLVARAPLSTGYRLPTEAEWERVARYPGGQGPLRYPWGKAFPIPPGAGNYGDQSAGELLRRTLPDYTDEYPATAPVSSLGANALGIFHLGGNVAEWVHDLYAITPSISGKLVTDPTGPAEGEYHVIRGASWRDASVTELRLSYRDYGKDARPDLGFRIARYAE